MKELSKDEEIERQILLRLQADHTRWFSKTEFDRLHELSTRLFHNAGSPKEEKPPPPAIVNTNRMIKKGLGF